MGGYLRVAVTMDISIDFGEVEWLLFFLRCAILCFCVDSFVRQRSKDPRQSQEYSRRSKSIDSYLLFTNAGSLNCKMVCAEIQWLWTWEADTTKCSSNFFITSVKTVIALRSNRVTLHKLSLLVYFVLVGLYFLFFFGFICSFQYRSSKCNGTLKITCFGGIACVTNTPCEVMNNFDGQTSTSAVSDHLLYILSFLLTSTFILVFMFLIFFLLLFIHFGRHVRAGQTLMVMIYATVLLYTVLHSTTG